MSGKQWKAVLEVKDSTDFDKILDDFKCYKIQVIQVHSQFHQGKEVSPRIIEVIHGKKRATLCFLFGKGEELSKGKRRFVVVIYGWMYHVNQIVSHLVSHHSAVRLEEPGVISDENWLAKYADLVEARTSFWPKWMCRYGLKAPSQKSCKI